MIPVQSTVPYSAGWAEKHAFEFNELRQFIACGAECACLECNPAYSFSTQKSAFRRALFLLSRSGEITSPDDYKVFTGSGKIYIRRLRRMEG